jgi:flagellar basal-body rod protein FlgC
MSLLNILGVSGSALAAQTVRLNTISSNLANAESVSGSAAEAYRAKQPVFSTVMSEVDDPSLAGVEVAEIIEKDGPARQEFAPDHPLADADGYIYFGNVNPVEEMANMISASRSYQNSVEAMNTAKQLLLQTLNLGR